MSQSKRANHRIKAQYFKNLQKHFFAILDMLTEGVFVCNFRGEIVYINQMSSIYSGCPAEEFVGRNIRDLVEDGIINESVTLEVLKTRKKVTKLVFTKPTNRQILVTGVPFYENNELSLVILTERDVTQLNATQEKLENALLARRKMEEEIKALSLLELQNTTLVAESVAMRKILGVAMKLARLGVSNILLQGESGTGKSLLAKFMHDYGPRSGEPFISINCAALPETLLEAELFGYEKGAFTGAGTNGKAGLIELAHKGSLFLDEIGDMPFSIQSKMLKYLDSQTFTRLGGTSPIQVDCLIMAATNRNLSAMIKRKEFRKDLYYRLSAFNLTLPPLRQREEDLIELVRQQVKKLNQKYGLKRHFSDKTYNLIKNYHFPGNIRELNNLIKKAVILSEKDDLYDMIAQTIWRVLIRKNFTGRRIRGVTGRLKYGKYAWAPGIRHLRRPLNAYNAKAIAHFGHFTPLNC